MLDILRDRVAKNADLIAAVGPADYGKPTPCAEFDVKRLLNHVVAGNEMLATVVAGGSVERGGETPDLVGDDPLGAYKQSAEKVLAAWSDPAAMQRTMKFPFGELPAMAAFGISLLESVVHAWDLAKATGQQFEIDPQIAEMLLSGLKQQNVANLRGEGGAFGPEVEISDDAPALDRLLAFCGRKP